MKIIYSARTCSDYWSTASLWGFTKPFYKWETRVSGAKLLDKVLEPGKNAGEMRRTKALSHLILCSEPQHYARSSLINFRPLFYPFSWIIFRLFIGQNNWVMYNKYQQNRHMHLLKLVMHKTMNVFKFLTYPFTIPLVFQTSEKTKPTDNIFPGLSVLTQNTKITQSKKQS